MKKEVLILSNADVRQCLGRMGMAQAIELIEGVMRALPEGRDVMSTKLYTEIAPQGVQSLMNPMPAYIAPGKLMGLEWIGGFAGNPAAGRPYIVGLIVLVDARTGDLAVVMEGSQITSMRTGASAGLAAKFLGRKGPATVAIVGAGVQGESVLEGVNLAVDIKAIRIVDVKKKKAAALAARFAARSGKRVSVAPDVQLAARGAQVVITATSANKPLVHRSWLAPGALVLTLGSHREVDNAVFMSADKLVVDNWEQAGHRGSLAPLFQGGLITQKNLWGELPDIVAGKLPGRQNDDEHIVCCEAGMSSQDLALACRVHQMAAELGLGTKAPFSF